MVLKMKRIVVTLIIVVSIIYFDYAQPNSAMTWQNPITNGLPSYGMKDFFLLPTAKQYYLVGTEYPNPYSLKKGVTLFKSTNLCTWRSDKIIFENASLSKKGWVYDIFNAPELHQYKGKSYLVFNGGNGLINKYKKTGLGIAVSDSINGKYTLLNTRNALLWSNHATIVIDTAQNTHVVYEMDGKFHIAGIDLTKGKLITAPKELDVPFEAGHITRYLDAPQVLYKDGIYHLTFSQFTGGYIVKVFHFISRQIAGPYTPAESVPLYTWLEAEASEQTRGTYPSINGYAPPTQVIFSNQIVALQPDKYAMVYHSSEKYAEPALCIDMLQWSKDSITLLAPKMATQGTDLVSSTQLIASHGYSNCIEIKNSQVRVVIEPNMGGRVLVYERGGKNIMYIDTTHNGWTFATKGVVAPSAGRFDIGPEAITPKRNVTWLGQWHYDIVDNQTVKITSEIDTINGIQIEREFSLEPYSSHLRCSQTVKNVSSSQKLINHWGRTFAKGGGIALVPLNKMSRFPKGYCIYRPPYNTIDFKPTNEPNVRIRENIIELLNTPSDPKFVMDNNEGWLGYASTNDLLFIKKYPVYQDRPYAEVTSATSSIWYNKDIMVELEPIGPKEVLQPNHSFTFTEDWWLLDYAFPKDRNLNLSKITQLIAVLK